MPRVFWKPYFQKGAGLARHAEPQAGNFQPIELMKSVSGDQTLCRQPCARTLCRQPCAGEPCAGLPCANPAGRGTRWHKVGRFRGQPYIYVLLLATALRLQSSYHILTRLSHRILQKKKAGAPARPIQRRDRYYWWRPIERGGWEAVCSRPRAIV